ncbi:aspartate kinase [Vagococcus humatus]|uniref:Aspartokinase n=1 Tax=Vagococcus humatus TaxID=1889241 RepID=A0A429Z6P6_9ENTE|nr:aspartate kinase [Vagococcus humatus]RST89345.1 aspartate kinase [Vagococcus humatus]
MVKVAKFGGSSVASPSQFEKVKQIIESDPARKIVVTSASGKESHEDHKITDLLYLCFEHKRYGMPVDPLFDMIKEKLLGIEKSLELSTNIKQEIDLLYTQIYDHIDCDYLVSRGEYLTAQLLADYLGYTFVDAKNLIFFSYDGSLDYSKMALAFSSIMEETSCIVVPGFYGAYPDGKIKTMSRGGSDITGSILANLSDATCYENWTDVSGILKADPSIVHQPHQIDLITYEELRELSYMGASVLHEEAIYPVKDKNIPIYILNTNEPTNPGTIILNKVTQERSQEITGIAGKNDFSIITVIKEHMSNEFGTIRKALEVLEENRIQIEHISTSIDTFSLVIDSSQLRPRYYDVIYQLKEKCGANEVTVANDISLIAVVSRFMKHKTGMSGRLFDALGEQQINISMISQTSNETTIILAVTNKDYERTIQAIYNEFE